MGTSAARSSKAHAYRLKSVPSSKGRARPFLKWAGGKTQLLAAIWEAFPSLFTDYREPFLGGGAVFFALQPEQAWLSDINEDLVQTYRAVRDVPDKVIAHLQTHVAESEHYYRVRAQTSADLSFAAAAARIVYLNRTCFNGLYRVNASGRFNVPFGRQRRPKICDAENLQAVSQALQGVSIAHASIFDPVLWYDVGPGSLVYLDPPYDPVSPTASFTAYARPGFGPKEQEQLRDLVQTLQAKGAWVVVSNADTPRIRRLYADFCHWQVPARRKINCQAARRGPVYERLVVAPGLAGGFWSEDERKALAQIQVRNNTSQ